MADLDTGPLLTDDEHEAMALSGRLANVIRKVIGSGPQAEHDWAEAAQRIHAIQHTILAQAAARAYPDLYRPLGGWPAWSDTPQRADLTEREANDALRGADHG